MTFKNLRINACPICGCREVVVEAVEVSLIKNRDGRREIREHCNGQRWEKKEFLCGFKTQWSPNFNRPELLSRCENDEDLVAYYDELGRLQQLEIDIGRKRAAVLERMRKSSDQKYKLT